MTSLRDVALRILHSDPSVDWDRTVDVEGAIESILREVVAEKLEAAAKVASDHDDHIGQNIAWKIRALKP